MQPSEQDIINAHISFPDPRCELFFEKALKPVADNILMLSGSLDRFVEEQGKLMRTVHGENYDNGMLLTVKQHDIKLGELKNLPEQLRGQVVRWGFYLLGANGLVSAVAIGILMHLVRTVGG